MMMTTATMTKNTTITKSGTKGQLYQAMIDLDQLRNDVIYTLTLPNDFQNFLINAMRESTNKRLHYKTLAKMLFHRFGYLFYVDAKMNPYKPCTIPFLYATKEMDLEEIKDRIAEWFEAESGMPFTYYSAETWTWDKSLISDFMENRTNLIYRFLASYFHDKIAQQQHIIKGFNHDQPLSFVHRLKDEGQTSCVSNLIWLETYVNPSESSKIHETIDLYPELQFDSKKKKILLPASVQIRYQIVTKPGEANRYFLNTNISLTRYPYWDFTHDVYNGTFRFLISSLEESMRDANEAVVDLVVKKEYGTFRLKYDYEIGLLEDLELKGFDLNQSIRDPLHNLLREKKYRAFPVFNNEMDGRKMFVEQGWSHQDRELIFAHFSEFTGFTPVPKLDNTSVQSNREKYPYTQGITLSSTIEVWDGNERGVLKGLKDSLLGWLSENDTDIYTVEHTGFEIKEPLSKKVKNPDLKTDSKFKYLSLLCQSDAIAKNTLECIEMWIAGGNKTHEAYLVFYPLEGNLEFAMTLKTKEQEHNFRFVHRDIKGYNGLLDTYQTARGKEAPNARKRVEEIKQAALTYSTGIDPVMALVNVPAYHKRGKSFLDSKGALRKGLALANRLPQFINFDETGREAHPYRSAFDDLLKHAGFLPIKLYKKRGKNLSILSEGETWLGLKELEHRYKGKTLHFAVACKIEYGKKPSLRIVGEKNWLPMDEFNKRAASGELLEWLKVERGYKQKREFKDFYSQMIPRLIQEEVLSSDAHYYVILDAPLRYYLKEIQNNELSVYVTPFYSNDRVSYIRYNGTEEVPELEVMKNDNPARDSGLYYDENMEIVYSLASKSDNMQTSFKLEKKNNGETAVSRQLPRELYVMGEPDRQKRNEIFEKVHKMRNGAITYNKESADVAPLNFIEHAKRLLPKE